MLSPRRIMVVLAVALVGAACGNGRDLDVVASVGGSDITVDHVITVLENEPDPQRVGEFDADGFALGSPEVARVVGTLIILEAIGDDVEALGVAMPDTTTPIEGGLQGPINELVLDLGQVLVPELTDAERDSRVGDVIAGYTDDTAPICASHILVLPENVDQIEVAAARLADGEPFAQVATEMSEGPSAPNGGSLGCEPASAYVPEFADALRALEVDEISEPVESAFGWHIIVRHDSTEALAEQAALDVDQAVGFERQNALNEWFGDRILAADVELDPAVGTWADGSLTPASLAPGR